MRKIGNRPREWCHPLRVGRDRRGERCLWAPRWGWGQGFVRHWVMPRVMTVSDPAATSWGIHSICLPECYCLYMKSVMRVSPAALTCCENSSIRAHRLPWAYPPGSQPGELFALWRRGVWQRHIGVAAFHTHFAPEWRITQVSCGRKTSPWRKFYSRRSPNKIHKIVSRQY